MTKTKYYDLQMDDPQDDYDVDVVNANLKKIDEQMKTRENATDALQEPEFTVAAKRENIASKEKMPKILGKIAKFFADLKTVAFSGKYNDLDGKPAIVNNNTTTEPGSALDARQANPNIEGTMAASIAQLNSNLEMQEEKGCTLVNATGRASYIRNGFMVQVIMEITPTKLENGAILLKGLPRPQKYIYMTLPAINGNNIPCTLNANGELAIYFQDGGNSISRIDHIFCYMCI